MNDDIAQSLFSLAKHNAGRFKSPAQAEYLLRFFDQGVFTSVIQMKFGDYDAKTDRNSRSVRFFFEANTEGVQKITKQTSKGQEVYWENTPEFLALVEERAQKQALSAHREAQKATAGSVVEAIRVLPQLQQAHLAQQKSFDEFIEKATPHKEMLGDSFTSLSAQYQAALEVAAKAVVDAQNIVKQSGVDPNVLAYVNECCEAFFQFGINSEGGATPQDLQSFLDVTVGFSPEQLSHDAATAMLNAAFNVKSYRDAAYGFSPNATHDEKNVVSTIVMNRWKESMLTEALCITHPYAPPQPKPETTAFEPAAFEPDGLQANRTGRPARL